jgi:hypothetical protein
MVTPQHQVYRPAAEPSLAGELAKTAFLDGGAAESKTDFWQRVRFCDVQPAPDAFTGDTTLVERMRQLDACSSSKRHGNSEAALTVYIAIICFDHHLGECVTAALFLLGSQCGSLNQFAKATQQGGQSKFAFRLRSSPDFNRFYSDGVALAAILRSGQGRVSRAPSE